MTTEPKDLRGELDGLVEARPALAASVVEQAAARGRARLRRRRQMVVSGVVGAVLLTVASGAFLALVPDGADRGDGSLPAADSDSETAAVHGDSSQSAARLTEAYLEALENQDGAGIAALAPKQNDAAGAANEKVDRFGGRSAEEAHVESIPDFGGTVQRVRITWTGYSGEDEILLVEEGDAWHIALGENPDPGGPPPADTTEPAS